MELIGDEDKETLQAEQPKNKHQQMKKIETKKSTALLYSHKPVRIWRPVQNQHQADTCQAGNNRRWHLLKQPYNKVLSTTK